MSFPHRCPRQTVRDGDIAPFRREVLLRRYAFRDLRARFSGISSGRKAVKTMMRKQIAVIAAIMWAMPEASAAMSWNIVDDYSTTSNPIGPWSYGRTFTTTVETFNLLPSRWHNVSAGGTGWYLGGSQWWPSICDPAVCGGLPGVWMWAFNNSNGYPVARWTSPASGYYDISGQFNGYDDPAIDNIGYVTVDGVIAFNEHVGHSSPVTAFGLEDVFVPMGGTVNFFSVWSGNGEADAWFSVNATISTANVSPVPLPGGLALMLSALPAFAIFARQRRKQATRP